MGYGYVLYYNEKVLNSVGVGVPQTKEELLEAISKIEALGEEDIHAYGITTQQHSNVYQDFCNFVYGSGSSLLKDGGFNFTDPKVIQAAQDYRYVSSFAPKGVSTEMLRQLFVDGKIAMLVDGPWVAALLDNASADLRPSLKLARPPFEVVPGSISNSLHIAEEASAERKKLVFEFIEQVARPENQLLYSDLTKSPAGRSSIAVDMTDPVLKLVNTLAADSVSILPASSNLMMQYSKYVDTCVNAFLKLQYSTDSVQAVLAELEASLAKEKLVP
jgi:multiple sugar transport system substrate-binding protein